MQLWGFDSTLSLENRQSSSHTVLARTTWPIVWFPATAVVIAVADSSVGVLVSEHLNPSIEDKRGKTAESCWKDYDSG